MPPRRGALKGLWERRCRQEGQGSKATPRAVSMGAGVACVKAWRREEKGARCSGLSKGGLRAGAHGQSQCAGLKGGGQSSVL